MRVQALDFVIVGSITSARIVLVVSASGDHSLNQRYASEALHHQHARYMNSREYEKCVSDPFVGVLQKTISK